MKAGDVPKFKMQGVEQCWHCKHRDGSGVHPVNGYWYRLPYCKVCDANMIIIYEPPCKEFEVEEGEWLTEENYDVWVEKMKNLAEEGE